MTQATATRRSGSPDTSSKLGPNAVPAKKTKKGESEKPDLRSGAVELAKSVGEKAVDIVETHGVNLLKNTTSKEIQRTKETLEKHLAFGVSFITAIPWFGDRILNYLVSKLLYPAYTKLSPNTKVTSEEIAEQLKDGKTDFLQDDIATGLNNMVLAALPDDESRKQYEEGSYFVAGKALAKHAWNTLTTIEGVKNLCNGIADRIPIIRSTPSFAKPWVGGAVGLWGGLTAGRIAWWACKKALSIITFGFSDYFFKVRAAMSGQAMMPEPS